MAAVPTDVTLEPGMIVCPTAGHQFRDGASAKEIVRVSDDRIFLRGEPDPYTMEFIRAHCDVLFGESIVLPAQKTWRRHVVVDEAFVSGLVASLHTYFGAPVTDRSAAELSEYLKREITRGVK